MGLVHYSTMLDTLQKRGYSPREILLGILPYIRDGCIDHLIDDGDKFVELDVYQSSRLSSDKEPSKTTPLKTKTVVIRDKGERCQKYRVVDAECVVDFTTTSNDIEKYLVDDVHRICGEVRRWKDERGCIQNDFYKNDAGYVWVRGQVVYEYEIYASKALDGSVRSGIYRPYKYSPETRQLVETGDVSTF